MTTPTPHMLRVRYDSFGWEVSVECPHAELGADRPCAVWDDEDGTKRRDECTFEQYADDVIVEDWLHGPIDFVPVAIIEGGSGDDWHAIPFTEGDDRRYVPR